MAQWGGSGNLISGMAFADTIQPGERPATPDVMAKASLRE